MTRTARIHAELRQARRIRTKQPGWTDVATDLTTVLRLIELAR